MAATIWYEKDADLSVFDGKKVAILGYGSQGHAHALNLRDSGVDVVVGLRPSSKSVEFAKEQGLEVKPVGEAVAEADVVMILLPDQYQAKVYEEEVEPNLKPGAALAFAHGFNIHYGYIKPSEDHPVFMVAPKGPGHIVRREYAAGRGVPVVVAVEQDPDGKTWPLCLAYAKALGALRAGAIKTTFTEETETDLFGEQDVLMGGINHLCDLGFDVLTPRSSRSCRKSSLTRTLRLLARSCALCSPGTTPRPRTRMRLSPSTARSLVPRFSDCRP